MNYDVVFVNGRLLDGTGGPWTRADVAVLGDRIARVGDLGEYEAGERIDIDGLYIAPGFIDVHSHAAGGLDSEERSVALPHIAQGVTTVIVNPDAGGPINMAGQRKRLELRGIGVNVGLMIGHGSLRRRVVGLDDREATADELDAMKGLVTRAMDEGAFGVTSGLFYTPGKFAPTSEVVEICKPAGQAGGVYASHIRDESNYDVGLIASVQEVIDISRDAKLPGIVTHIKALGPGVWGQSREVVAMINAARNEGLEVWADQYPWEASSTGLTAALVPAWARDGGRKGFLKRMQAEGTRAKIRAGVVENLARRGGAERIYISRCKENSNYEGKYLSELAADAGSDPVDFALKMLVAGSPKIVSFNMSDEDIERFMVQPWTMTSSDGGLPTKTAPSHPRSYGSYARKIHRYVVKKPVLDLATAIRTMSYLPASVFRIADRGHLRAGAYADLVVFDPNLVVEKATYDDPHQLAEGMTHVLVNGEFALRDGEFTKAKAGRVLNRKESPR